LTPVTLNHHLTRTPARSFERSRGGQPGGPWRARYCMKSGRPVGDPPRCHSHRSNCGSLWMTQGQQNCSHAGSLAVCPQSTALITTTTNFSFFFTTTTSTTVCQESEPT
jgi:hypothetical protein